MSAGRMVVGTVPAGPTAASPVAAVRMAIALLAAVLVAVPAGAQQLISTAQGGRFIHEEWTAASRPFSQPLNEDAAELEEARRDHPLAAFFGAVMLQPDGAASRQIGEPRAVDAGDAVVTGAVVVGR